MSQTLKTPAMPMSHTHEQTLYISPKEPTKIAEHHKMPSWLNTLSLPVLIIQDQNTILNMSCCTFLGIQPNSLQPDWQTFIHPNDVLEFQKSWQQHSADQQSFKHKLRLRHANQHYHYCQLDIQFQTHEDYQTLISIFDLQEQHQHQQTLLDRISTQSHMLDGSIDCIKLVSLEGDLLHANRAGCLALGLSSNEKFGMSWLELLPENIRCAGEKALAQAMTGQSSHFYGSSVLEGQEPEYWDNLLTPMFNDQNELEYILVVSRNMSQLRKIESQLQQVLEIDELTGLYNRRAYNRIFKDVLEHAKAHQENVGLLIIDLDYFKHINDTFGHIAGDHLLKVLGHRFKTAFPAKVTVARLGGDEFSIIIPQLAGQEELIEIAHICKKQLDTSIHYADQPINGGMSIGCSLYPKDASNNSNLLKCADIALNDLKYSGRGGIRIFNEKMLSSLEETTKQLALARYILKNDLVVPFYQPKVRLSDGTVIGFEALLRWKAQDGQLKAPAFINASFQDYDLASRISETMQLKIFKDMSNWSHKGYELLPVSINAAPVEFLRDNYAETLLGRLACFDIPYNKVEIEITEQSLAEQGSNYVVRALNLLKSYGIQISLDDFGTGHSSLTRLRDYPVNCIKIDRNFVENINHDPSALAIIKAITQIGSSISLDILVEGIESTEQLNTLKACDCQTGQGFYFYRPMPVEDAEQLLKY